MNNLTPDQIRTVQFDQVRRGGLDPVQVRRFVDAVASAIDRLTIELQQATKLMNAGEVGQAARVIAIAERVASEAEAAAHARAADIVAEGEHDAESIRAAAYHQADDIEASATAKAADIVAEAVSEANTIKAVAEAEEAELQHRNSEAAIALAQRHSDLHTATARLAEIGRLAADMQVMIDGQLSALPAPVYTAFAPQFD